MLELQKNNDKAERKVNRVDKGLLLKNSSFIGYAEKEGTGEREKNGKGAIFYTFVFSSLPGNKVQSPSDIILALLSLIEKLHFQT